MHAGGTIPLDALDVSLANVMICGAPRSGTSMMAQVLAAAGLNGVDETIPSSPSNPHGFNEDIRVNRLNDDLLAQLCREQSSVGLPRRLWWLAAFAEPARLRTAVDHERASAMIPPPPYVIKDPRFSITYPAWRSVLGGCIEIVMVRSAAEIASSVMRMVERQPSYFAELRDGRCDIPVVVGAMWSSTYRSVLSWASESTYLLDGLGDHSVLDGLSTLIGTRVNASAVDSELLRSAPMPGVQIAATVAERVAQRIEYDRNRLVNSSLR